jgi:hypothetical protein
MRMRKDNSRSRMMHQTPMQCPVQMKEFSETFHLIDKGNGKEAERAGSTIGLQSLCSASSTWC